MTDKKQATPVVPEPKSFAKRDTLIAIEKEMQEYWESTKAFELDAPEDGKQPKFMATFPYPYMNGRLHLGHSFSLSKVEFAIGYQRMKGKKALFPFGYHCTGMPIKASADKIKREVEQFGPMFEGYKEEEVSSEADPKMKSKIAAKTGGLKYQFQIMESMGVPREEIAKFADPIHWLYYFPPLATDDLKKLGVKVDWRRSFITTDINPYYDSFIRWQFNKLKSLQPAKIKFGERYTIYSPLDGQPCMDHDRASGEGVGVQEYAGIKIQVLMDDLKASNDQVKGERCGKKLIEAKELDGKKVFLVAATLRPETMYGQTNCYVGTELPYGVYHVTDDEVWIVTERAARNMAYQGLLGKHPRGEAVKLLDLKGWDLVGVPIKAPLAKYEKLYVVPMEGVLASKGTGIVTSVPSDSPDDFITVQDLIKKPAYYHVDAEKWLKPFPPIPIIRTPNYGDMAAAKAVEMLKIQSQKDKVQLAQAKEMVYKEGFYSGEMLVGDYKGKSVQDAKPLIKADLIQKGEAIVYCEPEGVVTSRSGDECVVSLVDQWYLDYGEEEWKKLAKKCLENMNTFGMDTRHQFLKTIDWLHEWACSRSFGLGSRLPWDPVWLIESLSDSTIYMAYYTVAHLLQQGSLDGSTPGPLGIDAKDLTDDVWEYVMIQNAPYPQTSIPKEKLDLLKRELSYWYPMDLRCSGKDLVPNHLTFSIYNHVAIFPEEKWPLGMRANGHLLLNSEKMSKSTGNFMTLKEAVEEFGADATRVALADAGDFLDDANFQSATANAVILRLFTQKEWIEEVMTNVNAGKLRTGPFNFNDKVFDAEMSRCMQTVDKAYSEMLFRDALLTGFYEMQAARDWYRDYCVSVGGDDSSMHADLIKKFVEWQAMALAPIAPHWSEYVWRKVLNKSDSVLDQPMPNPETYDAGILKAVAYIRGLLGQIRSSEAAKAKKASKKGDKVEKPVEDKKEATLIVADSYPTWQQETVATLKQAYDASTKTFSGEKELLAQKGLLKDKRAMPFAMTFKKQVEEQGPETFNRTLGFDEFEILNDNLDYITKQLGLIKLDVVKKPEDMDPKTADNIIPGTPSFQRK